MANNVHENRTDASRRPEHRERHVDHQGQREERIFFRCKRYSGDELRLTFSTYEGKPVIQFRDWYEVDGNRRPGKKGISLPVKSLPEIVSALDTAIEFIEQNGGMPRRDDPL